MGGNPSRVEFVGPLVPYVAGFREELESQGYRRHAVADQLRVMAHVSRWLASNELSEQDFTPGRVEEFLGARRAAGYVLWRSPKGVAPLLAYLRGLGAAPVPEVTTPSTPAESLLEGYRRYLLEERGLASGTVRGYLDVAGLFLEVRQPAPGLHLEEVTAEVAGLLLDDIDWRSGELLVRGKGPKEERLPLPADVGEAIAGWLRRGRPRCAAREAFTRVRAPHRGLTSHGVSAIVASAAKRANLDGVHAHRLHHTAATEMLRSGAGLQEIGQVLRHQSVLTTSIYAKLDRSALRELAKPWPTQDRGEEGR